MGFNEKVQAYLVAQYYRELTWRFGDRGREAFVHATRYYGEQRGRRMAQRAIRDGRALTLETYLCYGEWVNTEEVKATGRANHSRVVSTAPDYIKEVTICPWHDQFVEMGMEEAGALYCRYIDNSICRGFNPELDYQVPQSLNTAGCCRHIVTDSHLGEGPFVKRTDGLRGFDYHCAHTYWSFREVAQAVFGQEGTRAAEQVLAALAADYGADMARGLKRYERTNFNHWDSGPDAVSIPSSIAGTAAPLILRAERD